jgi:hypothetical protein
VVQPRSPLPLFPFLRREKEEDEGEKKEWMKRKKRRWRASSAAGGKYVHVRQIGDAPTIHNQLRKINERWKPTQYTHLVNIPVSSDIYMTAIDAKRRFVCTCPAKPPH